MKIKVTTPVLEYNGDKLYQDPPTNKKMYDIRTAIIAAINYIEQGEVLTAEEKNKIFSISTRVWAHADVDLTIDDLSFIKEKAGKSLFPLYYGRLLEVIDPK